jgi:hypothetical protein
MTEITALIGRGRDQLSMSVVPLDQVAQYACGDVEATFELVNYYRPRLIENNQEWLFRNVEMPLIPVLEEMERIGISIDREYLEDLDKEIRQRLMELDREITRLAGRPINVNSTRQLGALLFDEFKLPSGRRTKTGYSVDQDHLETLRDQHAIIPVIQPTFRHCQPRSTPRPGAFIPRTTRPSRRPAGYRRTRPICRTFRFGPKSGVVFDEPSWRITRSGEYSRTACCSRRTTRRLSCG